MYISFEIPKSNNVSSVQEVELYIDHAGAELLIKRLNMLLKQGSGHDHLKTPAWAGNELSEKKTGSQSETVHQVIITLV